MRTSKSTSAALGFSVHTGWAALVAVSRSGASLTVLDRRRVQMIPGVDRPPFERPPFVFHAARELPLDEAERLVAATEEKARDKAREAIGEALEGLRGAGQSVAGSVVITAKDPPPQSLESVLRSHSSIHAAEGALYRAAVRRACEELGLPVLQVGGHELVMRAAHALGLPASEVPPYLARVGRTAGPPWTADQKAASLAAVLALS